jgi:hypothetical protein
LPEAVISRRQRTHQKGSCRMTIFSGTEATSPEVRPLNSDEKNILYMLSTLYAMDRALAVAEAGMTSDNVVEAADAVMKVEGLLDRIIRTGLVSPVLSTLERCAS